MAPIDAEALRTFLIIHRARGFSAAAAALARSQPAISRRIALLEAQLKARLFERTGAGVVLSQAGRTLLPYAERVLAALDDASRAIEEFRSGDAGRIVLAMVGTLASTNLTRVLKRFAKQLPNVDVTLRTAASAEVSDLVRSGEAAIGLRYFADTAADLVCQPVATEKLVVVCPPHHRIAGKRVPKLAALREERWLAFPAVPGRREASAQVLHIQFLMRGVDAFAWTPVDSLTAQKRLVEAGYGLALLPESAIGEELSARSLATIGVRDLDAANPIFAVVRRNGYLSVSSRRLIEMIKRDWDG